MQAHGFVRNLRILLIGAGPLLLMGCGGGTVSIGVGGSSSGGSAAKLAGTFTSPSASKRGSDTVFGAVDTVGNGFFADMGGSSRAIFAFGSASQAGSLAGTFDAYAANGSNLGDGTTLQQGNLSGSVVSQSNVTTANVTFANTAAGFSNNATLVLDHPPLVITPLATAAGTYATNTSTTAIASSALSSVVSASYTATLNSNGSFTVLNNAGCSFLSGGTATPDGTYNIYALHVSGTCSGNSATITLDGLAVYLPKGSASPLDGSLLATDTLLLELSDFLSNTNAPKYAVALVASRQ